jgi:hypothetical protein
LPCCSSGCCHTQRDGRLKCVELSQTHVRTWALEYWAMSQGRMVSKIPIPFCFYSIGFYTSPVSVNLKDIWEHHSPIVIYFVSIGELIVKKAGRSPSASFSNTTPMVPPRQACSAWNPASGNCTLGNFKLHSRAYGCARVTSSLSWINERAIWASHEQF